MFVVEELASDVMQIAGSIEIALVSPPGAYVGKLYFDITVSTTANLGLSWDVAKRSLLGEPNSSDYFTQYYRISNDSSMRFTTEEEITLLLRAKAEGLALLLSEDYFELGEVA